MHPLYLDNHLLVLDKPWGLLTQPSGTSEDSLEAQGKAYIKERFDKPGAVFLEAVHRIDRPVAGVVLFARTSKALSRLNAQQREGAISKRYRAWVCGALPGTEGVLEDALIHDEHCARIVPAGTAGSKLCRLRWRILERAGGLSFLEISLETGRYHQIRAQLAHAGVPIIGDCRYGAPKAVTAPFGGIALTSWEIAFEHPVTREAITLKSQLQWTPQQR